MPQWGKREAGLRDEGLAGWGFRDLEIHQPPVWRRSAIEISVSRRLLGTADVSFPPV
jgi:hypothetical protein